LKDWVDPIVNHFWFCCQTAEGSEERIKVTVMTWGELIFCREFNTYVDRHGITFSPNCFSVQIKINND